jgi:hypothetical protein
MAATAADNPEIGTLIVVGFLPPQLRRPHLGWNGGATMNWNNTNILPDQRA